ncbi:MAG: hypothetical protein P4L43_10905 [Syntrophobacteraceae bacterium]|nr:hypothetical protein [Syntrophobacteraceae bacterium]
MELDDFISQCAVLDLEAGGDKIFKIGAIFGDAVFEKKEKFVVRQALEELDRFAGAAAFVGAGHGRFHGSRWCRVRISSGPRGNRAFSSPARQ